MANAWKQVSVEMKKALCEPISASYEAKQTPSESTIVSRELNKFRATVFTLRAKLERLSVSLK